MNPKSKAFMIFEIYHLSQQLQDGRAHVVTKFSRRSDKRNSAVQQAFLVVISVLKYNAKSTLPL